MAGVKCSAQAVSAYIKVAIIAELYAGTQWGSVTQAHTPNNPVGCWQSIVIYNKPVGVSG